MKLILSFLPLFLVFFACTQSEPLAQHVEKQTEKHVEKQAKKQTEKQAKKQAKKLAQTQKQPPIKPLVKIDEKPTNQIKKEKSIKCTGVFVQGGTAICHGAPKTVLTIRGINTEIGQDGKAIIGFDRDEPANVRLFYQTPDGDKGDISFAIKQRKYNIQRIDGLPPSQVSTFTKAQLAKIKAASARKKVGFASREKTVWLEDGFDYPLKTFKKTSPFGSQRILNGEKKRPHYGVDIAAPKGTPIYAPADGKISLADDDLYFEGAMVLIDHGQGLISMYLHMDSIDVKSGQMIKRGEKIGTVGAKGRATGPHLCWRMKWRNRYLDPEALTKWPDDEH